MVQWYWMIFSNTIDIEWSIFIVEWYVQIPLRVPLKHYFIIEWANGIQWYSEIPFIIPLKSDLLLKSMFRYHWEYNWYNILVLNSPMILNGFSNTIENTLSLSGPNIIETTNELWFIVEKYVQIPLRVPLKHVLSLNGFNIEWSSGTEWYSQIPLTIPLKYIYCWMVCSNTTESTIETIYYYWIVQWNSMVFPNTIDNTTEVWFIVEWYVQIPLRVPLKHNFRIEWSNGIERYSQIPLRIPLQSDLLLNSMFRYHWEYHWNMFYHCVVQWLWMILSNTIENTTEIWLIIEQSVPLPLRVPMKPDLIIKWSSGTEWYSQMPLTVPLKYIYCWLVC